MNSPADAFSRLIEAAKPVLKFTGAIGPHWMRNVKAPDDPRRGPWLRGDWEMLDEKAWKTAACVYFLLDDMGTLCYVGKSTAKLQTRWKLCPALDAKTGRMLPKEQRQMFHSQCWGPMMESLTKDPGRHFELRVLPQADLEPKGLPFEIDESIPLVDRLERCLLAEGPEGAFAWNRRQG